MQLQLPIHNRLAQEGFAGISGVKLPPKRRLFGSFWRAFCYTKPTKKPSLEAFWRFFCNIKSTNQPAFGGAAGRFSDLRAFTSFLIVLRKTSLPSRRRKSLEASPRAVRKHLCLFRVIVVLPSRRNCRRFLPKGVTICYQVVWPMLKTVGK